MKILNSMILAAALAAVQIANANPFFVANAKTGPFYGKVEGGDVSITRFPNSGRDSLAFGMSGKAEFCLWYNPGENKGWWMAVYSRENGSYTVAARTTLPVPVVRENVSTVDAASDGPMELVSNNAKSALSDDGKVAAIHSGRKTYFVSLENGTLIYQCESEGGPALGSWSPDSGKYAFLAANKMGSEKQGGYVLTVFDLPAKSVRGIGGSSTPTATAFAPSPPVWSSDSGKVVYTCNYSEKIGWRQAYWIAVNESAPAPTPLLDADHRSVSVSFYGDHVYAASQNTIYVIGRNNISNPGFISTWNVVPDSWQGVAYRPLPSAGLSLFTKWDELWMGNHQSGEAKKVAAEVSGKASWLQIQ